MTNDNPTPSRCFICSYDNPNGLEEHHIVPRRYGGSDQPENLVHLCASCHAAIEKLYDDDFYHRLGIKAETREGAAIDMDTDGTSVAPGESLDREIRASWHIKKEDFTIKILFKEFYTSSNDEIAAKLSQYEDHVRELLDGKTDRVLSRMGRNGQESVLLYPENKREDPAVAVMRSAEAGSQVMDRLHCGYCHTVFSEDEHSNMARHLRIAHGIDDPYMDSEDSEDILGRFGPS